MAEVEIVCFRVHPSSGFAPSRIIDPLRDRIPAPNWQATNSAALTTTLHRQFYRNRAIWQMLSISCQEYADKPILTVDYDDAGNPSVAEIAELPASIPLCTAFRPLIRAFQEIFSRDEDALRQRQYNVVEYCVVVLYRGQYSGHIYTWLSPVDAKYCYCMGIRNRVDTAFLSAEARLPEVAKYLFEGCRRFALLKDASYLIVTNPTDFMAGYITKAGFQRYQPCNDALIGSSLGTSLLRTPSCYVWPDINQVIKENPMAVSMYD